MIFRDEAPYLKEWIEFHRLVGVQHFYLCSHNSTDHYKEVLEPYINSGLVELSEIETEEEGDNVVFFTTNLQCGFYTKCLKDSRGISKWIAFLDSDEFLFPTEDFSLLNILKDYEECVGIGVNWQMFGTSWVEKIQDHELLIEVLTRCMPSNCPLNSTIKSIIRPEAVIKFANPHFAIYRPGVYQVNTDKVPFVGAHSPYVQVNKLRINHYWLRDEFYFHHYKIPRRLKWGHPIQSLMQCHKLLNSDENTSILRFVPKLREILIESATDK
jgi:hypothetical protein